MIYWNHHNTSRINEPEVLYMKNYNTLSSNLKRGIVRFSERIATGMSRPDFKFVSQMMYGMLCSQSCHLSKMARVLDESIRLKKTIERLSRNLAGFREGTKLFENYIRKIKGNINERSILIIDDGDVTKPCSTKLEGLGVVRDGSTGELGIGYHMLDVTGAHAGTKSAYRGIYKNILSRGGKFCKRG